MILSIGTGRKYKLVDSMIRDSVSTEADITHVDPSYNFISDYEDDNVLETDESILVKNDIFNYLEQYSDEDITHIYSQRVFEHIKTEDISYLLYLLYECSVADAKLEIIVPNFQYVFQDALSLDADKMTAKEFNRKLIECTTELFNEPTDPHRSIWTTALAKYYIELEGYWKIDDITHIKIDQRSWYMKITASSTKADK